MSRCLTPDEYAAEHKVSVRTVYRLIKAGRIPAYRVGVQWRIYVSAGDNGGQHRTARPNPSLR